MNFEEILNCFKQVNTSVNELSRSLNNAIQNLSEESQSEPTYTPSAPSTLDVGLLPVPNSRWKPKLAETYYYIDEYCEVDTSIWSNDQVGKARFAFGNVFPTSIQAESSLEQENAINRVLDRIHQLNQLQGWAPDFTNTSQIKYSIGVCDTSSPNKICLVMSTTVRCLPLSHYGSEQTISTIIKEMNNDCKLMLGDIE